MSDKDDKTLVMAPITIRVKRRHFHVTGSMEVMSAEKKRVRENFRNAVFGRDAHKCAMCGTKESDLVAKGEKMDAHHIVDRNEMPNGGYVKENGISLCPKCHELAEVYHSTGTAHPGYAPDDLFRKIGSDAEKARKAAEKLG